MEAPDSLADVTHEVWLELSSGPRALVGSALPDVAAANAVATRWKALAETHPDRPPHYYLSLLGTHPDHRGKGLGMALLAENLAMIDSEGVSAYLESSNPVNVPYYQRFGFDVTGEIRLPGSGPSLIPMWRRPR